MTYMSLPKLCQYYNNIPDRLTLSTALCAVPWIQQRGRRAWDVETAGEALIEYYHRLEDGHRAQYDETGKPFRLKYAEMYKARAEAIAARLREVVK